MTSMLFSETCGMMIHENNLKKKSRDTVPLNHRHEVNSQGHKDRAGYTEVLETPLA